jgi:hypothetical protein
MPSEMLHSHPLALTSMLGEEPFYYMETSYWYRVVQVSLMKLYLSHLPFHLQPSTVPGTQEYRTKLTSQVKRLMAGNNELSQGWGTG